MRVGTVIGDKAYHKYHDNRKTEGKNPWMTYFFDKNVKDVLTGRAVIKKEQKRKPTQKR